MNPLIEDFENKLLEDPENEFLLNLIEKSQKKNISKMKAPTTYMLEMLNDIDRNEFYKKLIEKYATGKDILEIGCGLGLLCKYLVDSNCSSLTTCEINPHNFNVAKSFLKDNGIYNKVSMVNKSSYELRLNKDVQKVDYIIQELWPNNGFGENILSTVKNAKRFLKPTGKILPGNFELNAVPVNLVYNQQFRERSPDINVSSWDRFFANNLIRLQQSKLKDYSDKIYTLFSIDLNSDFAMKDSYVLGPESLKGYNAILIYLRIFEKDLSISTWDKAKDQHTASLWQPLVYLFEKGSAVKISYDRDSFSVASEERLSSV